eukprot:4500795-Amphidinium_carterae.1
MSCPQSTSCSAHRSLCVKCRQRTRAGVQQLSAHEIAGTAAPLLSTPAERGLVAKAHKQAKRVAKEVAHPWDSAAVLEVRQGSRPFERQSRGESAGSEVEGNATTSASCVMDSAE